MGPARPRVSSSTLAGSISPKVPRVPGLARPPAGARPQRIKYVPGTRATVRVEVAASGAAGASVAVFGHAYPAGDAERAYGVLTALWESAPRRDGDFRIPRPLGCDRAAHVVWQEALEGLPLGSREDLDA